VIPKTGIQKAMGDFSYLLVALLIHFLAVPLLPEGPAQTTGELLALSAVLLSSMYALHGSRRVFVVGAAVIVPALVGRWLSLFTDHHLLFSVSRVLVILLFIMTTWSILRYLMKEDEVTADTLYGAVSAYLLLGLIFGTGYTIVESVTPGSFANLPTIADVGDGLEVATSVTLDYFSLVTLTTLGYGDVTPLSQMARSLAIFEAIVGQFYLAVLVARLVGLFMARRTASEP
jgi:hypothetical protein